MPAAVEVLSLDSYEPDPCCSKHLAKALRTGALKDKDSWVCPKCGCEWKPRMVETVRHWEPNELIEVIG